MSVKGLEGSGIKRFDKAVELKGKRILVTGGAGFVGSHLVDLLAPENEIIVVDDLSAGEEKNLEQHKGRDQVRIVEADVRCGATMKELTVEVDIIYHLAAKNLRESIRNPEIVNEVNVTGTVNVCQAALANKVERFIYVSSSEVYGSGDSLPMSEGHPTFPRTPYGASKLAGEAYALSFLYTHKVPVFIIRPFNCYGPRCHYQGSSGELIPRFIVRAMHGLPLPVFGDGLQTRCFSYVEDIARGIVDASMCDTLLGRPVNIASGEEMNVLEVGRIILDLMGTESIGFVHHPGRPGDIRRQRADVSLATASFQFKHRIGIREGLERQIRWMQGQPINWLAALQSDALYNWENNRW